MNNKLKIKIDDALDINILLNKIERLGINALTNKELIVFILNFNLNDKVKSSKEEIAYNVIEFTRLIENRFYSNNFKGIKNISKLSKERSYFIQACQIIIHRQISFKRKTVTNSIDIFNIVKKYADFTEEVFLCLTLSVNLELIGQHIVTKGIINQTTVHPRELFYKAIKDKATNIIVAHNHPSGDPTPSNTDITTTKKIMEASHIMGIQLLDHIVFTDVNFYSFLDNGDMENL